MPADRAMTDIDPTDIWRTANMMIELYGEHAMLKAAMRADGLLEQGDTEGFFVWKRIARAIDDLPRKPQRPMNRSTDASRRCGLLATST